jgi:hypothetical protein
MTRRYLLDAVGAAHLLVERDRLGAGESRRQVELDRSAVDPDRVPTGQSARSGRGPAQRFCSRQQRLQNRERGGGRHVVVPEARGQWRRLVSEVIGAPPLLP